MSETDPSQVTHLLKEARGGKKEALEKLFPLVYEELRRLSASRFRDQGPHHTLQPTVLVHEVYLRVVDRDAVDWKDRAHFFALAAKVMRQVLVDHARRHAAQKRGGDWQKVTLTKAATPGPDRDVDVLALEEALGRLAELDARKSQVVEMRLFGGLSMEEVAEALDVSLSTVESDWYMARAWLRNELEKDD